jgi:two-component sensor histidine kinase
MNELSALRALYEFTDKLYRVESLEEIYESALDTILSALHCTRASILLFDRTNTTRFVAWRGLSDEYRNAVEGHSPWTIEERDPEPICVDDIARAEMSDALKAKIRKEGIRALAFVPLVANGRLIGKFMTYYEAPHDFSADEIDLALTIGRHLGFSVERIRAEAERNLLVAELGHRVKNTLATVIAIAHQTFSGSQSADAQRSFERRIQALAQTHDRLSETNWSGVSLAAILRDETAPYRDSNVHLSGPDVMLSAKSAVNLGMAFHELTTNAAKYGALSQPAGNVDVKWNFASSGEEVEIQWSESGGPPVAMPDHSGFGRRLLERALTTALNGRVEMDFATSGLKCRIAFPLQEPRAQA